MVDKQLAEGGTDAELRRRSIAEIVALDLDGNALGGLSVGEDRARLLDTVAWAAPLLPAAKARYFMGIGDPAGLLELMARGVDMFDCVLPTRLGRTGTALWDRCSNRDGKMGAAFEPGRQDGSRRSNRAGKMGAGVRPRPAKLERRGAGGPPPFCN